MKKVAIYICDTVSKKCTATGCFKAFNNKADSFEIYDNGLQLVAFNTCNGCDKDPIGSLDIKIEKLKKAGVDSVHLSTCIRGRCEHYKVFAEKFAKYFDVIGYTHGSAEGKKNNNINIIKKME